MHGIRNQRRSHVRSWRLLWLLLACSSGCGLNSAVLQCGGSPYSGELINLSCHAQSKHAIDPAKPTIVLTHGWNPFPKLIRTTLADAAAASIRDCYGQQVNVLSWDWNAVRIKALRDDPVQVSRMQGMRLAQALQLHGVSADHLHLVGHSLGTMVVAQASQSLARAGKPVRQVTLLDAPGMFHGVIFDDLQLTNHAGCVENYWADGVSGYGKPTNMAGVSNFRFRGEHPLLGIVDLSLSNHVDLMRWYVETIRCGHLGFGFQRSFIAAANDCSCRDS